MEALHLPLHLPREDTQAEDKEIQPCLIRESEVTPSGNALNLPFWARMATGPPNPGLAISLGLSMAF